MYTCCDVPFGFLIFKSILSKSKRSGTQQKGTTIHPSLITQLCERASVQNLNDLYPRTTMDLDRNMMNLGNVIYSFFTPSLSQTSMNPPSFVPEPSLHPTKLVPQHLMDLSYVSYHTAASSGHSSAIAAKQSMLLKEMV
ncbi:hypothetical protein DVH24_030180 [Malus domestica]|uniref:Uncharacterized protein n=1 Tax=Malus domestica TaxID=3750 RepID=A0A498HXV4_MALDO|nr:hypothetical protein DVH24_030180 [Malus domestica]